MILVAALLLAIFVLDSPWDAIAVAAGAVIEVAEAGFWLWLSKRRPAAVGREALIGRRATVVTPCRPGLFGQVRVVGELWEAECDEPLDPGDTVRVRAIEGLTLVVAREANGGSVGHSHR